MINSHGEDYDDDNDDKWTDYYKRKVAYPDHNESVLDKEVEEQRDEARITSLLSSSL